jgi:hypothetical protein
MEIPFLFQFSIDDSHYGWTYPKDASRNQDQQYGWTSGQYDRWDQSGHYDNYDYNDPQSHQVRLHAVQSTSKSKPITAYSIPL